MGAKEEFAEQFEYWSNWVTDQEKPRYDIALFKIWIYFEKYLTDMFINYATRCSNNNKLHFIDDSMLNPFISQNNKGYIEYLNCIERLTSHMFKNNPFDIIISDSNYAPIYKQLQSIRNYIAHESQSSKTKLLNALFSGDEKHFKGLNEYLGAKNKEQLITNYSYYINSIKEIITYIEEFECDSDNNLVTS